MSDLDLPPCSGTPARSPPQWSGLRDAIARAQRLVDSPRPSDGYPLAWCVEGFYLGDISALAATTLRAADPRPEGRPGPIQ